MFVLNRFPDGEERPAAGLHDGFDEDGGVTAEVELDEANYSPVVPSPHPVAVVAVTTELLNHFRFVLATLEVLDDDSEVVRVTGVASNVKIAQFLSISYKMELLGLTCP